mgnify:CR=1 FL=1
MLTRLEGPAAKQHRGGPILDVARDAGARAGGKINVRPSASTAFAYM